MKAVDLFSFSWQALAGHRIRTSLSIAGVAVGIAAVVALTALGEGARLYVLNEFSSLGSNLVVVLPGKVETTGAAPFGGVTHDMTIEDFKALTRRLTLVKRAAPLAVATEIVRYRQMNRSVAILGTTRNMMQIRHLRVASGDFLPARDPDEGGNEIVLGAKVAKELFGAENPLGKIVRMGIFRFRVVGVTAHKGHSLGFDMDDVVILPVRTVMKAFNRNTLFRILCEVRSKEEVPLVKDQVLALFKERHRAEDVTIMTQDAVLSALSKILQALTLALAGIASISLAVAGVGIMNLMLVSVSERRSEIGILKAIGVTNRQVLSAFLVEASLLSTFGGILGLLVGIAAVHFLVRLYPSFPATPPWWAIFSALALSTCVGITFGLWPAWRATRLDPVTALSRR